MIKENLLLYERKVQCVGKSFLITLPKAWCRSHNIGGGSRLYINLKETGELSVEIKNDPINKA